MIKYVIFSLFLGAMLTLSLMQYDQWVYTKFENYIINIFKKELAANIEVTVESFSLVFPKLILSNITVNPIDHSQWSWSCQKARFSFTWWHFLTTGILDIHATIDGWNINTQIDKNKISIHQHLQELFEKSSLPVDIDIVSVNLNKTHIFVYTPDKQITSTIISNSRTSSVNNLVKMTWYILEGNLMLAGREILTDFSGSINANIDTKTNKLHVQFANGCSIKILDNEPCYMKGIWDGKHGRFSLSSAHNTFFIDPIIISQQTARITGQVPIKLIYALASDYAHITDISGNCLISLNLFNTTTQNIQGYVTFQDVVYGKNYICDTAKITIKTNDASCSGKITMRVLNGECEGNYLINSVDKTGSLFLQNKTNIKIPGIYWQLPANNSFIKLDADENSITGICSLQAADLLSGIQRPIKIDGEYKNQNFFIKANSENMDFLYSLEKIEDSTKHDFQWINPDKELAKITVINDGNNKKGTISGLINFESVQKLTHLWTGYQLQGVGEFDLFGNMDEKQISANLSLCSGAIRLPETYNFINAFSINLFFNRFKRECIISDTSCQLHLGNIQMRQGRVCFDDSWKCSFIHIPVLINDCLINIKKDLFASTSGAFSIIKNNSDDFSYIKGTLFINKAQIKKDINANFFDKIKEKTGRNQFSTSLYPLLDLQIKTIDPIKISTPQIETDVHVRLHLKEEIVKPNITGTISFTGGKLIFPYKPLYITRGKMLFTSGEHIDPTIELIAKNYIKNYAVSLQIAGTALNHHIMVDATPPLSQEQIIALLLFGSPNKSLHALMPALITDNFTGLLFGEHQSQLINIYVQKLFKPLSVNLIPSFTDQSGRGGLRLGLEIDINDRLRGLIQKNFSLTEDTRFELEYQFSDDILMRTIRDERRDIAGEVEMRWKF